MATPLPPTVVDQEGNEWWTVAEAARRWGVRPRRIYKWISGIAGSSKGLYTRKDGTRAQRTVTHDRIRLNEGADYVQSKIGNRVVILIRPQPYPEPIKTPMVRPEFIGQGEHHSTISYEANVDGGYVNPSSPFIDPFQSEFDLAPRTSGPESISEVETRAKPGASRSAAQAPEQLPPPSRLVTDAEVFRLAQQMVARFRGRFAERNRLDPSSVSVADLRSAARQKADADRLAAEREGEDSTGMTAESVLLDVFGQLFQSIYREEPWTTDNAVVSRVRDAFIEVFRQNGPLDGIAILA